MNDLYLRCLRAYFRKFGTSAPQPSQDDAVHDIGGRKIMILSNCNGELARFDVGGSRIRLVES